MKRLISFSAILQFRQVIRNIQHAAQFTGLDANGEPIYDKNAPLPKLRAIGSEKLHGTQGAVCYSESLGLWAQSKKNIITLEKDNAGCAVFVMQREDVWMKIINDLADKYQIDLTKNIIAVFFEFCGGNIQKNSAVSGLNKRAVIFQHFKVAPLVQDDKKPSVWYETKIEDQWICDVEKNIFNVMRYPVYQIEIDFEHPLLSQNKMIEMVEKEIEPDSPIGRAMGKDGNIGEGIVFTIFWNNVLYRWKIKGSKHSKTKVKTLKAVDESHEKAKIEFANYACSAVRLEQCWTSVFGIENEKLEPTIKATGDFLRNVFQDILKEESDIMIEKGLNRKDIGGVVAKIAKRWFMDQLDKEYLK